MLGAIRTIWIAPAVGALGAVALELPIILLASWFIAVRVVRRFGIGNGGRAAKIGGLALILLWLAELALTLALGGTVAGFLQDLATPAGMLGFAGQIAFALFPLAVVMRRTRKTR